MFISYFLFNPSLWFKVWFGYETNVKDKVWCWRALSLGDVHGTWASESWAVTVKGTPRIVRSRAFAFGAVGDCETPSKALCNKGKAGRPGVRTLASTPALIRIALSLFYTQGLLHTRLLLGKEFWFKNYWSSLTFLLYRQGNWGPNRGICPI